jgi:molybdopterin-containing oxidoreductase family iron-sulfur binding subunit
LQAIVDDLLDPKNHGKSVLCAGPSQPAEVHAAVHRMNKMLGNTSGSGTIFYTQLPNADRPSYVDSMRTLVGDMNAGRVKTLLILGGNPVYNAPADLNFTEVFKKVETSIHLSGYCDETSRCCTWHLPRAHFLEAWGDGRAYDGTYSVIQPMIEPLRNGRSSIEVISMILSSVGKSELPSPEKLVQQTFHDEIAGKFGTSWQEVVREGLVVGSSWPAVDEKKNLDLKVQSGIVNALPNGPHSKGNGAGQTLEAIFRCSRSVLDGRYSNNSWLQELPDPLTKLTWGNAALIGPTTAQQLGVENESLVDVKIGGRQIRIPVYILPGQAAGTIDLWLGYGRRAAGKVGGEMPDIEPVGVDVYPLRTTSTMDVVDGVAIVPTGEKDRLAVTQNHHAIDTVGREAIEKRVGILIRQTTLEHFQKQPDFAQHMVEHPPLKSLWPDGVYEGHRWAMSIDLSKCIGCSACVVACQAENNIPVVGRQQVMKSREMHWLRVDRYFRGDPDHPQVADQPLPCQQCEMAPCEQVCPVAATVHSDEGLNDMVYNRCVGIRYCANNCPYKVRHFNFFNYHKEFEDPKNEIAKMKYNPQVTVRSRGVMEKCTYCVQRIQTAKIVSKNTGQPIRDGQIQTACQQACPTGAIIFGDLSDDASQVHRLQQSDRAYAILAELNTRPRTVYLASVRNPNPKLQPTDEKHDRPNA